MVSLYTSRDLLSEGGGVEERWKEHTLNNKHRITNKNNNRIDLCTNKTILFQEISVCGKWKTDGQSQRAVCERNTLDARAGQKKFEFSLHVRQVMGINNSTHKPSKYMGTYRIVKTRNQNFS